MIKAKASGAIKNENGGGKPTGVDFAPFNIPSSELTINLIQKSGGCVNNL